jgi:hypothetical protein
MSKHEQLKNWILSLIKHNVPITVIALQETWSIPHPELVNIPGFRFIYKCRNGRGGGVGFYIKEEIQFRESHICQFVDSQFENIVVEATICKKKILFM